MPTIAYQSWSVPTDISLKELANPPTSIHSFICTRDKYVYFRLHPSSFACSRSHEPAVLVPKRVPITLSDPSCLLVYASQIPNSTPGCTLTTADPGVPGNHTPHAEPGARFDAIPFLQARSAARDKRVAEGSTAPCTEADRVRETENENLAGHHCADTLCRDSSAGFGTRRSLPRT